MTIESLKQHEGQFGLMIWGHTARLKQIHGKIKCIDDDKREIIFKSTLRKVFTIKFEDIKSFEAKEPLGEVTEVRGRKVIWDGGILVYADNSKEYDAKR